MREIPDCASVNQHRRRVYGTADACGEGARENLVFRNIGTLALGDYVLLRALAARRRTSHTRVLDQVRLFAWSVLPFALVPCRSSDHAFPRVFKTILVTRPT